MQVNAIIRQSQRGFPKGKSCVANLRSFRDAATWLVSEGLVVDVVFPGFREAFGTVAHGLLLDPFSSCEMN